MPHFSFVELLIVLVIVLVLFGGGRVAKLGGELGSALREFRRGLNGDDAAADKQKQEKSAEAVTKNSPQ